MSSKGFRIPVALDVRGKLVPPDDALRGGSFRCPQCEDVVDLHAGEIKARHFHHRVAHCSAESVAHLAAKRLIVDAVEEHVARQADAPVFVRSCASAGCSVERRQSLPAKIRRAVEEHHLPSGHVADVALLGIADLPVAVIEIHNTHRVTEEKALEIGIPWIEVEAEQVCRDRGRVLIPIRDRFVPFLCDAHASDRGSEKQAERDDREQRARIARGLPYRLSDFPGLRVDCVARCSNGHEAFVFGWDGSEPPWPRPPEIVAYERERDYTHQSGRLRAVLPFRRGWRSICHRCGEPLSP